MSTVPLSLSPLFPDFEDVWNALFGPDLNAAVRATGIDPATNKPVSQAAADSLRLKGVDPNDPNSVAKFVDQTQQDAQSFYDSFKESDFQQLGGVSFIPFSPVVGGDAAVGKSVGGFLDSLGNAIKIPGVPDLTQPTNAIIAVIIVVAIVFLILQVVN